MKQLNNRKSKDMELKLNNYVKELKKACELVDTIKEDINQDYITLYTCNHHLKLDNLIDEDGRLVEVALDEAGFDIDMAIKALEKKIKNL